MKYVRKVTRCRVSGERLDDARVLISSDYHPLPGIYPVDAKQSLVLRVPMHVVQAQRSRVVQLAHRLDPSVYRRYSFAGAVSAGYSAHQAELARRISMQFDPGARILEIGCGDGCLLGFLQKTGLRRLYGMEPSRRVRACAGGVRIARGYFPRDIPHSWCKLKFDLIIVRQALEHIETPVPFVRALASRLSGAGQVWIEVPDLVSTLDKKLFSNFYPLHCTYFTASTLNMLMAGAGLAAIESETVDVFGGSILARYAKGRECSRRPVRDRLWNPGASLRSFAKRIDIAAGKMPADCVGYGAAERTAALIGFCPSLETRVKRLYDRNRLLHKRYLGGTSLEIRKADELFRDRPAGVILFAISHQAEIIAEFKKRLPPETVIMIADYSARIGKLAGLNVRSGR